MNLPSNFGEENCYHLLYLHYNFLNMKKGLYFLILLSINIYSQQVTDTIQGTKQILDEVVVQSIRVNIPLLLLIQMFTKKNYQLET